MVAKAPIECMCVGGQKIQWLLFTAECCLQSTASPATSEFEQELADYMKALKLPAASAAHVAGLCSRHDFSAARTHLIISRPGYHSGVLARAMCCSIPPDQDPVRWVQCVKATP